MSEDEDCLHWPVKYSSNEAGGGVRQEMERSPQGKEHHSPGDTREGRAMQAGGERREEM